MWFVSWYFVVVGFVVIGVSGLWLGLVVTPFNNVGHGVITLIAC